MVNIESRKGKVLRPTKIIECDHKGYIWISRGRIGCGVCEAVWEYLEPDDE